MLPKIEPFWEGYITALSNAEYSYSEIIKQYKRRGFTISKKSVSCVLNKKGNARLGLIPQQIHHRTSAVLWRQFGRLSPFLRPESGNAKSHCIEIGDLHHNCEHHYQPGFEPKKRHKSRVHKLLPRHIAERATNSRKLYERYLASDKWVFVVTLDEVYVYLSNCNKPGLYSTN